MIEETEDEDMQRMNVKDKLDTSLSYLIDDGKDQGKLSRFAMGNTLTPQVRGENKKPTSYICMKYQFTLASELLAKYRLQIPMIVYLHYIQHQVNIYLIPKRKQYY